MKTESTYKLRKRIKELEAEVKTLKPYRNAYREIFWIIVECADISATIRSSTILRRAMQVMP